MDDIYDFSTVGKLMDALDEDGYTFITDQISRKPFKEGSIHNLKNEAFRKKLTKKDAKNMIKYIKEGRFFHLEINVIANIAIEGNFKNFLIDQGIYSIYAFSHLTTSSYYLCVGKNMPPIRNRIGIYALRSLHGYFISTDKITSALKIERCQKELYEMLSKCLELTEDILSIHHDACNDKGDNQLLSILTSDELSSLSELLKNVIASGFSMNIEAIRNIENLNKKKG